YASFLPPLRARFYHCHPACRCSAIPNRDTVINMIHRKLPSGLFAVLGLAALLLSGCTRTEPDSAADPHAPASGSVSSAPQTDYLTVGFSTVYSWSAVGPARKVRITGRLHRCDGTELWLPQSAGAPQPGDYVLYRYVVDCCPGHSVPAVIELGALPEDTGN